jgi:hypothetical protein
MLFRSVDKSHGSMGPEETKLIEPVLAGSGEAATLGRAADWSMPHDLFGPSQATNLRPSAARTRGCPSA